MFLSKTHINKKLDTIDNNILVTEQNINEALKTLLYFDVFDYPISKSEIVYFSKLKSEHVDQTLNKLLDNKIIFKSSDFYSVKQDKIFFLNRIESNSRANKILDKAKRVANFISKFPFVSGVFISGSLSKGCFAKDDDIDFFIITKPNRLWIARTLLILYKKIFLLNSKKYFCVNYFMSEDNLEIPHKNRFTATESVTLIPVKGKGIYQKFIEYNNWIYDFFPNISIDKPSSKINSTFIKRFFEIILNGKLGNVLETVFMKITTKHQKHKYNKLKKEDFEIAFKSDDKISKHHPQNHQDKTILALNEKIKKFNKNNNLNIPLE
jgi:hypothetical protein